MKVYVWVHILWGHRQVPASIAIFFLEGGKPDCATAFQQVCAKGMLNANITCWLTSSLLFSVCCVPFASQCFFFLLAHYNPASVPGTIFLSLSVCIYLSLSLSLSAQMLPRSTSSTARRPRTSRSCASRTATPCPSTRSAPHPTPHPRSGPCRPAP